MKKIIVVGTTGSGKSTLAKSLAKKLNYPYIQLDLLFWEPNWTESTDEVFFKRVEEAVKPEQWVLDGNYGRTNHLTWKSVDTVIWIDLPFWLTFYQCLSRGLNRAITQEELWPNTNNRESLKLLFSKKSILLWLFKTYETNRVRYQSRTKDPQFAHIKFIHLKSRKEMREFLEGY